MSEDRILAALQFIGFLTCIAALVGSVALVLEITHRFGVIYRAACAYLDSEDDDDDEPTAPAPPAPEAPR